jgi:hypothetical protein
MTHNIPYVISEAHPDYKRPYLYQDFGTIDEKLIDTFFVEKVTEFIYDRCNIDNIKSVDDISTFWENYYDEYYMDNSAWDAVVFINREWKNVMPTDIQIFECFKRIKKEEKDEEEQEQEQEQEQIDDNEINVELTSDEEIIQQKMKEFLESELTKSDLEEMNKMNKNEQMIYILNKCILNISSEKYKSNRELFYGFMNIILKFTEKDIEVTTKKMEQEHDEKMSEKLNYLVNIYGNLLEYKTIFNHFRC